jgi:Xaa-Pro aminopeptidase
MATGVDERICHPVAPADLERRRAAACAAARDAGLDALLVQGANALAGAGGYFRWFTGLVPSGSYPNTLIVPADGGLMTLVGQGPFGGEARFDGTHPMHPGVGRRLSTPSFPAIGYTGHYDAELVAGAIAGAGYRRIGLVCPSAMYHGIADGIRTRLPDVAFVDASDLVDPLRAEKSAADIAQIRAAAAMQDAMIAKVGAHIRPGMRDFEVMAYAEYVGALMGGETGYCLGCSAPPGQPAAMRMRNQQNRRIEAGDVFLFQAENTGPGGFFVHAARYFVLGKAPQALTDAFGIAVEAQDWTVRQLVPGASCRAIFADYNAYMQARGLPPEKRLHCHSQGYDVVERPLVRDDEAMAIGPNMNIGIHPSFDSAGMWITVCDNFLLGADGRPERLHKTPQRVFEL